MIKLIEWTGTGLAITAASMLALNIPISGWAFILYALSNIAWAYSGVKSRNYALVTMQGTFFLISIVGIWNWLL